MTTALLPEAVSIESAAVLIVASFFTSGLTASAGIGGGMLMLALMTYLVPINALIAIHGFVQLGSNAGRSWVQRRNIDWRVLRLFLLGGIVGAVAGAMLSLQFSKSGLQIFLACFILVLVWFRFPPIKSASGVVVASGGLGTTFISMFAGATGPLVAVFLDKLFSSHKTLVATLASAMTVQHGLKVLAFGLVGFSFSEWLPLVLAIIVSGYLGTLAGTAIMIRMPEKILKQAFRIVVSVIAFDLLRRGLAG